MFNISEAGAAAYDWILGKIQGFDTTDPVEGGVTGVDNIPLTALALRTRNIHDRLKTVEDMLVSDSDTVINNLRDILDAFSGVTEQVGLIGLLARKACNVSDPSDKASWVNALEIAKRTYNLNSTEKATWVAGLELAQRACNLTTQAEKDSWYSTLGIAASEQDYVNWKADVDSTIYWYASKDGSNIVGTHPGGAPYNFRVDFRNALELPLASLMVGRCEINWGDIGAGGASWRSIGRNRGIWGVLGMGPGIWSTTAAGTVAVPVGHSLFEIFLTVPVNVHKCLIAIRYSDTVVGNDHVVLGAPSQPNNIIYVLIREPSSGIRNEFGHIHVLGPIDDLI